MNSRRRRIYFGRGSPVTSLSLSGLANRFFSRPAAADDRVTKPTRDETVCRGTVQVLTDSAGPKALVVMDVCRFVFGAGGIAASAHVYCNRFEQYLLLSIPTRRDRHGSSRTARNRIDRTRVVCKSVDGRNGSYRGRVLLGVIQLYRFNGICGSVELSRADLGKHVHAIAYK